MNVHKICICIVTLFFVLCIFNTPGKADQVYLEPEQFLIEVFGEAKPDPKILWITKDLRVVTKQIMTHSKGPRRIRYWAEGSQSAWILEEIGKVKPITTGIVIKDGRIERVSVLIYRESGPKRW